MAAPTARSSRDIRPAIAMIQISGLIDPSMMVKIETDAILE
jgi:hypothetical protein